MGELLSAAQMRAIEQAAIGSGEVTGLELMERAGKGVVAAIFEEWPRLRATSHRAVVLCGPGNNGGDGFVVARLLHEWGWAVEVFLYGDAAKLPPDARANYRWWRELGEVVSLERLGQRASLEDTLLVDAIFGTGLRRPLPGALSAVANAVKLAGLGSVSIDAPSGLCLDCGKPLVDGAAECVACDMTATFHTAKIGHFLADGPRYSGNIRVVDIGLKSEGGAACVLHVSAAAAARRCAKKPDAHKYTYGHALILSGGPGMGGAARRAARGALRVGAGLVTLGCPPKALAENAAQLNAIMVRAVDGVDALVNVLADVRLKALCIGPGLGTGDREAALLAAVLASPSHPSGAGEGSREGVGGALPLSGPERGEGRGGPALVLDADALTLMASDAGLFAALHDGCVLTPHAGEFARLFPDIAEKLNAPATKGPAYSKVDAVRAAAARAGCVVLFKGPDTVIADAEGCCSINSAQYGRAAPWLATAGSGDVLAGFIAGLLARGLAPFQAAETGAWLHVECALKFGPGLIAEDLAEQVPAVFRALGI
ncbi:NAD(P)H-hydrate epimerase [Rhodobacteraceae bacterium R_SAG10]|nr:NAD(P)H-hydrate epimerase [Rhodobacteraceae bacterium R_SAG10]